MKDYYKILELSPGCSIDDIKKSYRRLAKMYHPDLNKSKHAHELFIEINEAYEILMYQAAQKSEDRNIEDDKNEEYEEFINAVREEAQKRARMRYEKFAREHEAFRESGLYDAALILKYIGKFILPFFALGLISIPVAVSISEKSAAPFFYLFFFWVIGGFLLFDVYTQRKKYFKIGKFYYSFGKLLKLYTDTNENSTDACFYCKGRKANSRPFKLELLKIKDVQLDNAGPLQHYARYDHSIKAILLPRSQKAYIVHSVVSCIKVLCVLGFIFFFPVSSIVWRILIGLFAGWLISTLVLSFSRTYSKVAYFLSYGTLIKIGVWLLVIVLFSKFNLKPFNIETTEYIKPIVVLILFLDSFLEQLIKLPKKRSIFKPLAKPYNSLNNEYFQNNYQLYLEVPIWTVINPLLRWIF